MRKRLIPALGIAALLALTAGCGSAAPSTAAPSSAPVSQSGISSPATTSGPASTSAALAPPPRLTLRPASGPAGTRVTISGRLDAAQVRTYEANFLRPAYFSLITDVYADCATAPHAYPDDCSAGSAKLAGCELIVDLPDSAVSLDSTTGRVTGSFTVGGGGTCFQDRPTGQPQPTLPGRYALVIGAHANTVAVFTVAGLLAQAPVDPLA
jgi:hypothetical protein